MIDIAEILEKIFKVSAYQYTPNILPSIFTLVLLTMLVVYALRRRNLPGAAWFILYCLIVLLFLTLKVIGYHAIEMETKIIWFNLEYPWWLPATTALTCFVLEYVWPGRWISRRIVVLLFAVSLSGFFLSFSNELHYLLFRGYGFNGSIVPLYGPIGWAFVVYSLSLTGISVLALAWLFMHSTQHRWPAALIMLAALGTSVLLVTDPFINEAGFFFIPENAIPVAACAVALFGLHILDPISLACQTVIEQLQAGMLVLDLERRVVSINPAAEKILSTSEKLVKGRHAGNLFPGCPENFPVDSHETKIEIARAGETGRRCFRLRVWPLNDFRGQTVGYLLLITDVTEQERAQALILEQQRSLAMLHEREQLARELHDNLGQVIAFVNTQGQTIHRLMNRGDLSTADEHMCRLLDVAREADVDIRESIVGLRATITGNGFHPVLMQYLAYFEKTHNIRTLVDGSAVSLSGVFEPSVEVQLLRILQEALTNVRKHANAGSVQIGFVLEDGWAKVNIRDDGCGFDPDLTLTAMQPHIGLRVMHERAEEIGGNLCIKSALGLGTELELRIPIRETLRAQV